MTEHNIRRSALVGLGVTLALVAMAWAVGGLKIFHRSYSVSAVFSDASDVASGDPVRVAGVDVGKVTAVQRLPHSVRMSLDIKKGIHLSEATTASLKLRTLLGKKFVDLADPGSGPAMRSGALIPMDRTRPAVGVDEVITAFQGRLHQTDVTAMNGVMREFDKVMAGREGDVNKLLVDLSGLTQTLAARKGDIDTLIAASDKLSAAVDQRRDALGTSVNDMAAALDALAARRQQLSDLVTGVEGLSERLTPLITHNQGNLDAILSDLQTTAQVLVKEKDRVDLALTQLPDAIGALRKVTKEGAWINVYTVGFPGTPYVAKPLDLGDNRGREPGKTGGLPQIWLQPPPHDQSINVAGINVDTENHNQPPPQGYYGP